MPAILLDPSLLASVADGRFAPAGHREMLQEQQDRKEDKKRDEEILSGQDRAVSNFADLSFSLNRQGLQRDGSETKVAHSRKIRLQPSRL